MSDRNRKCECKKCKMESESQDKERNQYNKIVVEYRTECEFRESKDEEPEKSTSMFVWSSLKQQIKNTTQFQYVTFENSPIGSNNATWTIFTQSNYQYPTNFIVQISGWYIITYKIDIRTPKCSTESAIILTRNGTEITGSMSLAKSIESNTQSSITNSILVDLTIGDSIALLWWSNEHTAQIGSSYNIIAILPNGAIPRETSASIIFTKI